MGDISAEPSMEDILSSIKRIIAEEDAPPARQRRQSRSPAVAAPVEAVHDAPADLSPDDEVLELNDPMPPPAAAPAPAPPPAAAPIRREAPVAEAAPAMPQPSAATPPADPILSQQTAAATRGSLEILSRLMVKPEPTSDGTLEGLVREMLRPMLREWLDANLPEMVETMVAKEIARITGQPG